MRKIWSIVLAAAAIAVAHAAAAGSAVPAGLVGTWGKTVTAATWKKHGISYEPAGHWSIRVAAGGRTALVMPPGTADMGPLTTMHTRVTGRSVTFGPTADGFCPG